MIQSYLSSSRVGMTQISNVNGILSTSPCKVFVAVIHCGLDIVLRRLFCKCLMLSIQLETAIKFIKTFKHAVSKLHRAHYIPTKTVSRLTIFDVIILRNVIAGCGAKLRASYSAADNPYSKNCTCKIKMMFDSRKFVKCFVFKISKFLSQLPSFLLSDSNIVFHIWRSMVVKHLQKFLSRLVQTTLLMFSVLEVCELHKSL